MKNEKNNELIKPIVGLVFLSLASLLLLGILIFFCIFLGVELNSWANYKSLDYKISEATVISKTSEVIGQSIEKNPSYLTYLNTIKR